MKKTILVFALLSLICFCMPSFTLVKQKDRPVTYHLNKALSEKVSQETLGMSEAHIMNYSMELTASYLKFSAKNDIDHGKANCVGYAQLCAAICNKGFQTNQMSSYAKPVVGYVSAGRFNLCKILVKFASNTRWKNFVKDHDFVEFCFGEEHIYQDPCLFDVIDEKCITFKLN